MKRDTLQTYRQRILAVMVHIQDHLEEPLRLDDLARLSFFSPYHFHRVFRAMVGESVHAYVRRLRLELAALRLKQTDRPVLQLALDAGYETHESFTRAFRAMFGVSPTEFRDEQGVVRPASTGLLAPRTGVTMDKTVKIEHLPARRIAFVRHVGPYGEVGPAFETLMGWAAPRGLIAPGVAIMGVCHDDPHITPPDKLRYDAALTVDESVQAEGEIGVTDMPASDYAVVCHEGPYDRLGETYDYLYGQWLPNSGREPGDAPPFEVYLNHPDGTDPEDLLTDVHIPLAPRNR